MRVTEQPYTNRQIALLNEIIRYQRRLDGIKATFESGAERTRRRGGLILEIVVF